MQLRGTIEIAESPVSRMGRRNVARTGVELDCRWTLVHACSARRKRSSRTVAAAEPRARLAPAIGNASGIRLLPVVNRPPVPFDSFQLALELGL